MNKSQSASPAVATFALEQLYSFEVATEMIPMPTKVALSNFLFKHKEIKPLYRKTRWYEVGFLTGAQIIQIRELTFHGFEESRYSSPNHGRPRGLKGNNPINNIIKRAMSV